MTTLDNSIALSKHSIMFHRRLLSLGISCIISPMSILNSVSLFIGFRYTRKKHRGYLAFVSLFALIAMALGVFTLIVVLSVMNGFDRELKHRILRVVPHGYITSNVPIQDWQGLIKTLTPYKENYRVVGAAPYISGQGLVSFDSGVRAIEIQGILPDNERRISEIHDFMLVGELEELTTQKYGIVLGSLLARYLGVTMGDKVNITLPDVSVTPAGVFPRIKRFTVVGVFQAGAQVDESLALIHLPDAQKLFRYGDGVEGVKLRFDDIYDAPIFLAPLVDELQSQYVGDGDIALKATDWSETQGSLFQAVKMEKTVVGIMLGVIIAVAAFNIVTSLVMMVAEKRSDIAVLRTQGLSRFDVVKIFMVQGVFMGGLGIFWGCFFGVIVANYLPNIFDFIERSMGWQLFDPNVYFVTQMPSEWRLNDTVTVCLFASCVSVLATVYPAFRAAQIPPAEALRYGE